jgi:hypothetical protein
MSRGCNIYIYTMSQRVRRSHLAAFIPLLSTPASGEPIPIPGSVLMAETLSLIQRTSAMAGSYTLLISAQSSAKKEKNRRRHYGEFLSQALTTQLDTYPACGFIFGPRRKGGGVISAAVAAPAGFGPVCRPYSGGHRGACSSQLPASVVKSAKFTRQSRLASAAGIGSQPVVKLQVSPLTISPL